MSPGRGGPKNGSAGGPAALKCVEQLEQVLIAIPQAMLQVRPEGSMCRAARRFASTTLST